MRIRQSYMMGVVSKDSRATAVGMSSGLGWGVPYVFTPMISSYIMSAVSSDLPIYLSAIFMGLNSVVYYVFFNKIKPPEERKERFFSIFISPHQTL